MDVSVVITCWNGRNLLEKNIPKVVKASQNPKNGIVEIIIADDHSSDDSVAFIEETYPEIQIVRQDKNNGYAANCNSAVKKAKGGLVAILNSDVIPNEDFLETSLPLFKNEKLFAVSFNEGKFGPGKIEWKKGFLQIVPSEAPESISKSDWANGGSSIFRKKIWEILGGMDELFLPFYFEDIDLCLRAFRKGFCCLWNPGSKVNHQHEATINSSNFSPKFLSNIKQRNHLLLTWKNINNSGKLFSHLFYLAVRCFSHPGYFKIVLLSLKKYFFRK